MTRTSVFQVTSSLITSAEVTIDEVYRRCLRKCAWEHLAALLSLIAKLVKPF